MSLRIPLTYCSQPVGHALVDDSLGDLPRLTWGLKIPEQARKLASGRPDLILAQLRDDGDLIHRCHPFTQLSLAPHTLNLRLAVVVIRPIAVEFLKTLAADKPHGVRARAFVNIRDLILSTHRVIFLNRSRVDLRVENLRELETEEPQAPEGVSHDPR